jgi:hypothetical protein
VKYDGEFGDGYCFFAAMPCEMATAMDLAMLYIEGAECAWHRVYN